MPVGQKNAEKPPSRLLVIGTVSFYLVAALAMVIANKWVLNATETPLFFLLTQLMLACILFLVAHAAGYVTLPLKTDYATIKGLAPMIGLNTLGLCFSNYTLKYVDASFYQVARGLVLPFTVLTSFIMLHVRPSLRSLLACSIVTAGFFVGVFLDGTSISTLGISFGVISSAITASHSVTIKQGLDVVQGSAIALSWYSNFLSSFVLVPIIIFTGEVPGIMNMFFGPDKIGEDGEPMRVLNTFIWGSFITGCIGFLMSIATLLSVKVTSPITHMVSSAVRGVAATLLGAWFFSELITTGRAASIAIILAGSIYYTWVKHVESQPKPEYERVPLDEVEKGKSSASSTSNEDRRD